MKQNKRANLIGVCVIILLILSYILYVFVYRLNFEPSTDLTETNTDAAVYSLDELIQVLDGFPQIYSEKQKKELEQETEYGTYVVPGLKATKTISSKLHDIDMCTSMTPQGMAITDQYILVTAYCHTHEHNSVIYMIDKETHQYVNTIVLPGKPHAGGFAYDSDHDTVWVSGSFRGYPSANSYQLSDLENYNLETKGGALPFNQQVALTQVKSNSYMTYRNHALYVGCFDLKTTGELFKFSLDQNGILVSGVAEDGAALADNEILPIDYVTMPSKVQGISFLNERFLMVSESYGMVESRLQIFENTSAQSIDFEFSDENAILSYDLPDKLEYACAADGKIYMLFEAAAYAYRIRPMYNVDRIITVDIDTESLQNQDIQEQNE
ncbi:MAG: hypothetical protein PHW34_04850 [Hespellia sp.]|nr:hypothetical protein [Hespellia sp.]